MTTLLDVETCAKRLWLSPATIRRWIWARQIESVKVGRRRLIPESAVEQLIKDGLCSASVTDQKE